MDRRIQVPEQAIRSVKGKNIRAGDYFEGEKVQSVSTTPGGNVSIKLENGAWRRRPAEERLKIGREVG
jgi:hypothetical protein